MPQPSQHEEAALPAVEFKTELNSFGVYRIYKSGEPTYTPDDDFWVNSVANGPNFTKEPPSDTQPMWATPFGSNFTQVDNMEPTIAHPSYLPFQNMSVFHLMQWFYGSSLMKSLSTLNDLVDRKSTRLNSSHYSRSRMPSSA